MFDSGFDNQRLMFHPADVAYWLEHGTSRGPLYTEMELTSQCECDCTFCGIDHLVNKSTDIIETPAAKRTIEELHALGNRSIMFAGHGESLQHPDAADIAAFASDRMSTSVTTNGLYLDKDKIPLIDGLKWIRFSINGCDPENYSAVHQVSPEKFDLVLHNVAGAVARKRRLNLDVTIGTQLVLIEENAAGVVSLARGLRELGVDYFSVKPYSRHPLSGCRLTIDYSRFAALEEQLASLTTDNFRVIYRAGSIAKVDRRKPYAKCYGTHFLAFVSADGDVWECNVFAGDPRFLIGNAMRESLADIWHGPRRKEVRHYMDEEMDVRQCRDICRMDACNCYLWRLENPLEHDDFI